jgi:hypothetical protein
MINIVLKSILITLLYASYINYKFIFLSKSNQAIDVVFKKLKIMS